MGCGGLKPDSVSGSGAADARRQVGQLRTEVHPSVPHVRCTPVSLAFHAETSGTGMSGLATA